MAINNYYCTTWMLDL